MDIAREPPRPAPAVTEARLDRWILAYLRHAPISLAARLVPFVPARDGAYQGATQRLLLRHAPRMAIGEPWLPLIECTFLEAVARTGGYTRLGIHAAKLAAMRLGRALSTAGFVHVRKRPMALRLALVATARVRASEAAGAASNDPA